MPLTRTFYKFSELSKSEQKAYFEANQEKFALTEDWYWCTIENIKEALERIGFSKVNINFSGFWSQGDGAHFTGNYVYKKGALASIKKEYPEWEELHQLAERLQRLSQQDFYSITFKVSHSGHYQHENCTVFDFEDSRNTYGWVSENFTESLWIIACKEFMKHIYKILENEYDYQSSWDNIKGCPEQWDHLEIEK
jgi:hypothetical protein